MKEFKVEYSIYNEKQLTGEESIDYPQREYEIVKADSEEQAIALTIDYLAEEIHEYNSFYECNVECTDDNIMVYETKPVEEYCKFTATEITDEY